MQNTPNTQDQSLSYLVGAGGLGAADEHLIHAAAHLQRLQVAGQVQTRQNLVV